MMFFDVNYIEFLRENQEIKRAFLRLNAHFRRGLEILKGGGSDESAGRFFRRSPAAFRSEFEYLWELAKKD
jgi:hypothetical protein